MNLLSVLLGPLNLNPISRHNFYSKLLPWAIQAGSNAEFLMNCLYEEEMSTPLESLRKDLGIQTFDDVL
jgi:ubiquinone biosynthesis protein Coq4